jgi:hypothetical protein
MRTRHAGRDLPYVFPVVIIVVRPIMICKLYVMELTCPGDSRHFDCESTTTVTGAPAPCRQRPTASGFLQLARLEAS